MLDSSSENKKSYGKGKIRVRLNRHITILLSNRAKIEFWRTRFPRLKVLD
ncbi:MAG: hypothetical protein LPK80_02470 [Bacteroidota bacterium]|nr:hypothetical protein [Bacteroidota bacterium]